MNRKTPSPMIKNYFSHFGRFMALAGTIVTLAASASNITYTYDPAGRLVAADQGAGKSISYAYDNAGNLVQSSQPAPGIVIGPVVGNQVTLSWPAAPGDFILESSLALDASAVWTEVGDTPTANGNRLMVTLSMMPGQTTFYRLRKLVGL